MGRRPRIHFDGAIYHVVARGVDRRAIFIDDIDRQAFLQAMNRVIAAAGARIIAYCLMGNHFHLAIQVSRVNLSSVMQRILTSYVLEFNLRHERTGHLFEARYKASLCLDDRYLAALIRYIHMNPVRAGLVARPEDWPWSTMKDVVMGPEDKSYEFDPWPVNATATIELSRHQNDPRRDLQEIGAAISGVTGISIDAIQSASRRRTVVAAKRMVAQEAVEVGYTSMAVACWLRTTPSSLTRYLQENTANTGKPDTTGKRVK